MPQAKRLDLRAQNAKLRAELHELQNTLRTIRSDEVDAFVIETAHGPQIFMLQELATESIALRDEILATISDAVLVYSDDERVLYLNAAAEARYGVTSSDALGALVDGIFRVRWHHPEDAAHSASALRDSGTWNGECMHVTRTGEVMLVEVTVTKLNPTRHQPSLWLVATHAASGASAARAQVKLETQTKLDTQARALRQWEAFGALVARVADDVSAMHRPDGAVGMGPASLEAATHRVRELREHLAAIDGSRMSERPLVSVPTIISEVVRLLRVGLPREIAIESACADTVPLVRADAIQLMQALLSLGGNAGHAMEARPGTLDIRVAEITVTDAMAQADPRLRSGRFIRIAVGDTGCGMDDETQRRAFEPYFSRKSPEKGVGLGLTRVHAVIEGHQGFIVVHSTPDIGSTFELYLPCVDEQ